MISRPDSLPLDIQLIEQNEWGFVSWVLEDEIEVGAQRGG